MDTPRPPAAPPRQPPTQDGGAPGDRFAAAHQRAVRVLTDAYAEGTVGDEEFERRLGRLTAAADTMAMEAVVAGLPDRPAPPAAPRAGAPPARVPHAHVPHAHVPQGGYAPQAPAPSPVRSPLPADERRMVAFASEIKRRGWWEVPRVLRVLAVMGDLELDLRDTVLPAGCTIEVACYLAAVKIIVRPGTNVRFDVLATLGTATSAADSRPGEPELRVTGTAFMGEVKVLARERGEGRAGRGARGARGARGSSWWGGDGSLWGDGRPGDGSGRSG